ncbi:MAG: 7-cyano-7-deazaguanine synthase [Planctomycetota bacterium]|nr:7-cyano-7-deazaguanine synthase [Planctomycetota bacterium]
MRTALLLSGGIDSAALAYWKRPFLSITIDYGQRAALAEIRSAREICRILGIQHEVVRVDCGAIGAGCMSDGERPEKSFAPPTAEWWPFRNQLIITIAGARAIMLGARRLMIGTIRTDTRHCDGTPMFLARISDLLKMQEGGLTVVAPAAHLTSPGLVIRSGIGPDILAWAHSCHTGNFACGTCPGCLKHRQVWAQVASRKSGWFTDRH